MITYACNHKKDYCPGNDIHSKNLCYQCKMELVGQQVDFIRFGKAPEGGRSWNYAEGKAEAGVSVYLVQDGQVRGTIRSEFGERTAYIGKGIVLGVGGDDEVVVEIVTIRKAIKKQLQKLGVE